MKQISKKDRFLGCFLGGAAGDALGYPVEFMPEDTICTHFGYDGIRDLRQAGDPALVTDDTQMTLFNMNGILYAMTNGKEIFPSVWLAHREWLGTQGDTSRMEEPENPQMWLYGQNVLHACRAPGFSCISAIRSSKYGGTMEEPVNNSKGCGAIMKAAPFGLVLKYEPGTGKQEYMRSVYELSTVLSAQTHGHPLGYFSGAYLALLLARIVHAQPGVHTRLEDAICAIPMGKSAWERELLAGVDRAVMLALDPEVSDLEGIHALGQGWVAEEALYISVFCAVRYQNDFGAAIRCAVNHEGDSDSTGSICGNILGAWLGVQEVEAAFDLNQVDAAELVREMTGDFYRAVETGIPENDAAWNRKYRR